MNNHHDRNQTDWAGGPDPAALGALHGWLPGGPRIAAEPAGGNLYCIIRKA